MLNSSSIKLCQQVWNVYSGSSWETHYPRFPLGAGHMGTLGWAHTKVPHFQKESSCSASTTLFAQKVQAQGAPLMSKGLVGAIPKSKFFNITQGPTLQAGLSKDSSLKTAMLTPFLHTICYRLNIYIPPNSYLEVLISSVISTWRKGLQHVIRFRLGHEGLTLLRE